MHDRAHGGRDALDEQDDDVLFAAARRGDEDDWRAIVHRHNPWMWRVCRSAGLGQDGALDAMQETWRSLQQHVGEIREPAAIRGWLRTTVKREALRRVRAVDAVAAEADVAAITSREPGPESVLVHAEALRSMLDALRQMNDRCRRLLWMRYLADPPWTQDEMATAFDAPRGSIGPWVTRCLGALREAIGAVGAHPAETRRAGSTPPPRVGRDGS